MASRNVGSLGQDDVPETVGDMAARTIAAKCAAMGIVTPVAVDAFAAGCRRISGPAMAGRTDQPLMAPGQRKAGRPVVIERPGSPVIDGVTRLALGWSAQRSLMMRIRMAIGAGSPGSGKAVVGMARHAFAGRMSAQQRKAGELMVEAHLRGPILAIVAGAAFRAEIAGVSIVFAVAVDALARQVLLYCWCGVAGLAGRCGVGAEQREVGHGVMIEINLLPVGFRVAARAILAVAAFVGVVHLVAADAGDRRAGLTRRLTVATLAGRLAVGAAQWELGHGIMVEPDLRPSAHGVAVLAFGPVSPFVGVVRCMAGIAPA